MKTTLTITLCLVLAASQGLTAQKEKKGDKPAVLAPREKVAATDEADETTDDQSADDQRADDGEPESPVDEDKPSGSKTSKKAGGKVPIKLDESGEVEVVERASYMQGYAVGKHFHERGVDL